MCSIRTMTGRLSGVSSLLPPNDDIPLSFSMNSISGSESIKYKTKKLMKKPKLLSPTKCEKSQLNFPANSINAHAWNVNSNVRHRLDSSYYFSRSRHCGHAQYFYTEKTSEKSHRTDSVGIRSAVFATIRISVVMIGVFDISCTKSYVNNGFEGIRDYRDGGENAKEETSR